ncbi:GNAT family N-acetyltransferase [Microbacterium sp. NPDC091313]
MSVEILPATADRYDDAVHALADGDGPGCMCQWWMARPADYAKLDDADKARRLRDDLSADLAPALIGYVDGDAAGWVRVGPRTTQPRIERTRNIASISEEPFDDPDVWAISCFAVRGEHRGEGLMARLLTAAVDHARAHGARVIEGYPVDTAVGRHRATEMYHGTLAAFQAAGFSVVGRPRPDRAVMSLRLDG